MGRLLEQLQEVFGKIITFDMEGLLQVLKQPEIMTAGFVALAIVIFSETGLLIGFCLPGDSLLVTVGIVAWEANWPLHLLMPLLIAAAIVGNCTGYRIGATAGPRLFKKEESFFFRKSYLLKAQAFYERHGGKTIILAQFMPIIRTFAPVVAGIGKMPFRRFLAFTVVGAIFWIGGMLTLGYLIPPVIEPPLRGIFGEEFKTAKHIEKVIILVVFLSISPGLYAGAKSWLAKRRQRSAEKAAEQATAV
jgi:membrane-associated protein